VNGTGGIGGQSYSPPQASQRHRNAPHSPPHKFVISTHRPG
jgi:hypothetical protein